MRQKRAATSYLLDVLSFLHGVYWSALMAGLFMVAYRIQQCAYVSVPAVMTNQSKNPTERWDFALL